MQCNCQPPLPAVTKTSNKDGSKGRHFFSCSVNKCNLFHWADGQNFIMKTAKGPRKEFGGVIHHPAKNKSSGAVGSITVRLYLVSFDLLARKVWFSATHAFHQKLNDYYRRIPDDSKIWDDKVRRHLFDVAIYDEYIAEITSDTYVDIEIIELPRFLIRGIKEFLSTLNYVDADSIVLNINSSLNDRLLDYQVEGIKYVIQRSGRAFIGDDMGLGKTVQALGIIQHYRDHLPALIIVPVPLIHQWKSEILKYCADIFKPSQICIIRKPSDRLSNDTKICIVPYTIIEKMTSILLPGTFGIVVADESHNIKNKDAKRTIASLPFLEQASVAVCLSGTPISNRPVEVFAQLSGILPRVFNDYDSFVKRYCDAKESHFKRGVLDVSGASNKEELNLVMTNMAMIRRIKTDVLKLLPDKLREVRYVSADSNYESDLKQMQKRLGELDKLCSTNSHNPSHHIKLSSEKDTLFIRYYEVTGMCKVKGIQQELTTLLKDARIQRSLAEAEFDLNAENEKNKNKNTLEDEITNVTIEYNAMIDAHDQSKMDAVSKPELSNNTTAASAPKVISMASLLDTDRMAFTVPMEIVDAAPSDPVIHKDSLVVLDDLVDSDDASIPVKTKKLGKKQKVTKKSVLDDFKLSDEEAEFGSEDDDDNIHDFIDYNEDFDSEEDRKNRKKSSKRPLKRLKKASSQAMDDSNDEFEELKVGNKAKKTKLTKVAKEKVVVNDAPETVDWEQEKNELTQYKKAFDLSKRNSSKQRNEDSKIVDLTDDNAVMETIDFDMEQKNIEKLEWGKVFSKAKAPAARAKRTKNGRAKSADAPVEEEVEVNSRHKGLGKKILVFVHHHTVMNAIEAFLREEEVGYIRIDGTVNDKKRAEMVERFQEDDVTIVALLSITACGTGLNLTRANVVLFAELFWSTGGVLQAEDRVHRIGQDGPVKIIYLLCKNSADDTIWKVIQSKHNTIDTVVGINGKEASSSGMVAAKPHDREKDKNKNQSTLAAFLEVKSTSDQNTVNNSAALPVSTKSTQDVKVAESINTHVAHVPTQYEVKIIQPQSISSYYTQPLMPVASVPPSNNLKQQAECTAPLQSMSMNSKSAITAPVSIQNPHIYPNISYAQQNNNPTSISAQTSAAKPPRPQSPNTVAKVAEKKRIALEKKRLFELQNGINSQTAPAVTATHENSLPSTMPKNENVPTTYNFTYATGKTISVSAENCGSNDTNTHASFVAPVKRSVD